MRKKILVLITTILAITWFVATIAQKNDFLGIVYTNIYYIVAFFGGVFGLITAQKWGGLKSYLGKSLTFLSLGLLLTVFGQLINSYFVLVQHLDELPYPSVAEIGFFGAVLLYIMGSVYLAKTIKLLSVIKRSNKFKVGLLLLIPFVMVLLTLSIYIVKYDGSESTTVQILLDFAYPIGQSIFAVIAIAVLLNSKELFGGKLGMAVVMLLTAFIVQYIADLNFLYQNLYGSWSNGAYGDFIYMLAYALMAVSIQLFVLPKADTSAQEVK